MSIVYKSGLMVNDTKSENNDAQRSGEFSSIVCYLCETFLKIHQVTKRDPLYTHFKQ